jgi:hypothetical protein
MAPVQRMQQKQLLSANVQAIATFTFIQKAWRCRIVEACQRSMLSFGTLFHCE